MSSINASSVVNSGYGGSGQAACASGRNASVNHNAAMHAEERLADETIWANMELLCRSLVSWEGAFLRYDGQSLISTFAASFVYPVWPGRESTKDSTKCG